MKSFLCGMALLSAMAAPVAAETRYDRNLEKAVMDIVAGKMGNIPRRLLLQAGSPTGGAAGSRADGAGSC
ncbi:hypothetical protein [Mesorhizobium sp.]|uniref:hypothetical protein n=1 Tax=Mesorhizobium sp. TaxID=1871066 RepID=UPI0025BDA686|nr:hypothetical protein [Mesorhizobium sp.]